MVETSCTKLKKTTACPALKNVYDFRFAERIYCSIVKSDYELGCIGILGR